MKFDEVRTKEDFIAYMSQKMLNGVEQDKVSMEDCKKKCKELGLPESILRMHLDIHS